MARPVNTHLRRAQIVDGLQQVMAERGYARASITAIGKAAGLSPGLVHYHFGSKQEVLLALVDRLSARLEERLEEWGEPRGQAEQPWAQEVFDGFTL